MKMKWLTTSTLGIALAVPAGFVSAHAYAAPASAAGQYGQERPWDQAPDEYRDIQRQGFHEGLEAARSDWQNHSHKDMDDHRMYKHPPVDRQFVNDFRDGFKHGYEMAMRHMREAGRDRDHDRDEHPY